MYFEYNKHLIEYMRRYGNEHPHKIHLLSIKWLHDNLQLGRDFLYSGKHPPGPRSGKSFLIVYELSGFANENDLLAFRLATGL